MRHPRLTGILALLAMLAGQAGAHHSTAMFDQNRTIEVRGVLREFALRNPHSFFVIEGVVFEGGTARGTGSERWEIESDATASMRTAGIDAGTFQPGDLVSIRAVPHRRADHRYALATSLVTADGREFLFRFRGSNRIFSPSLRSALGRETPEEPAPRTARTGLERMAGRWQQPITRSQTTSALPLNEAGRKAWADYDPKRSPANTCEPISIPELFNAPFFLFEIQLDGTAVILRHELYDVVRRIPLAGAAAAADPGGRFGIALGRLDNDRIIVESRGYPPSRWGLGIATQVLGGGADVPSSAQKTVTEQYSVSPDGRTLVLDYTVRDPVYLGEPYRGRVELTRVPEGTPMYPYECDPDSAARWSRSD